MLEYLIDRHRRRATAKLVPIRTHGPVLINHPPPMHAARYSLNLVLQKRLPSFQLS